MSIYHASQRLANKTARKQLPWDLYNCINNPFIIWSSKGNSRRAGEFVLYALGIIQGGFINQ